MHQIDGNLEVFSQYKTPMAQIIQPLKQVQEDLHSALAIAKPSRKIQIVLFHSPSEYRRYLSSRIPQAAGRRALFYKFGDVYQIYASRSRFLMTDLRHEFTHAVLHQALPYVPLWIDEGLAEYMEDSAAARQKSTRLAAVKWKARTGWRPDFRRLENLPDAADMDGDDYRDSWACIHYLLHESEATRSFLREYLQAISAGEAPGDFTRWVQVRDDTAINRIGSYFRKFRISLR